MMLRWNGIRIRSCADRWMAEEKGLSQVRAQIYSFNGQSRNLFLSIGFEPVGDDWYVFRIAPAGSR